MRNTLRLVLIAVAVAAATIPASIAMAIIFGGEGNSPQHDPGWPKGAAAIFNSPARIAWWEGPPFGGGQYHGECRGNTKTFNTVLADFARVDAKTKRLIIHDGDKHSFWLNPNREPAKQAGTEVDWIFMVWQSTSWEDFRKMHVDSAPSDMARDIDRGPPVVIDVYTGGRIRWADVRVPPGIEVIDERLQAHGFTAADGIVLEGRIIDLATGRPLAGRLRLERVKTGPKGERHATVIREGAADTQGRWVLKNVPADAFRLVAEADGYVPRLVGYARYDQPGWHPYECGLLPPATISGRVTDDAGKPLADVEVRLRDVGLRTNGRYESPQEYTAKTDAAGRFRLDQVPVGSATIWLYSKAGYCRPGLGQPITAPAKDIVLNMIRSARLRVTVDFAGTPRPNQYDVEVRPEGGSKAGTWGGSARIDANNQISYDNIPPGRYVVQGRPNPSTAIQRSRPLTVELKGGQTAEVTLSAN